MVQLLFNMLLQLKKENLLSKALLKLREIIIKFYPSILVNYKYHNRTLRLYLSNEYPFILKKFPQYSQNLGVVAQCIKGKYNDLKVIDVGANVGDSALILKHYASVPVLCVEGNPKFLPILRSNISKLEDVYIIGYYVGEKEEKVETVNYFDTARLQSSVGEAGVVVKTMNQVLEGEPQFKNAKLLKIDTDGFDNKIIRSSKQFIESANPVVFFEYDPKLLLIQDEQPDLIFDVLSQLGYTKLLLFNNFGTLLCETSLEQMDLLRDLTGYFTNEKNQYLDICAFHKSDIDLVPVIKRYYTG